MSSKTWRRFATSAAVISVAIASAVVGGASTSQAATGFTVDLHPLIGTAGTNVIGQVTFGGKIGYTLHVRNTGQSTTQHVQIVVTNTTADATYFDDNSDLCGPYPGDTHKLLCTPPGSVLRPQEELNVNFRFTAPSTATTVSTTAAVTVAAQSVGGANNQGTILAECPTTECPVLTDVVANGSKNDTFLRAGEPAATGDLTVSHLQRFAVALPSTLLGAPFGVPLSIHDETGSLCATCLPTHTTLTIPDASTLSTGTNPFYNGIDPNQPYPWSMSAKYTSGFKLTGILHVDDALVPHPLPTCESIGGAPTVGEPLCYFAASLKLVKSSKTAEGNGLGLENGNFGFN